MRGDKVAVKIELIKFTATLEAGITLSRLNMTNFHCDDNNVKLNKNNPTTTASVTNTMLPM
jgi:hypothetical protein